jgi:hypothetical protein
LTGSDCSFDASFPDRECRSDRLSIGCRSAKGISSASTVFEANLSCERAYIGLGVTVTSMNEEQSERRLVRAGLRTLVALTPRRQLFALHPARSTKTVENVLLAAAKARKRVKVFIIDESVFA